MPFRRIPLETNFYYHLFNRSVARVPIFKSQRDFRRAMKAINYYRFQKPMFSFSKLARLSADLRKKYLKKLEGAKKKVVEIISFCLMPNHFHFLIKQNQNGGIVNFLRNFQNSYAKYFNIRYKRKGPLFQNRFKAVLVEDDNQLLHLSRYIHLNPYSSMIIRRKRDIVNYAWSSLNQYLGGEKSFCSPKVVLEHFSSSQDYLNFVLDRADYQRKLEQIKHLTCE